jgi:predicted nucleic acid-binding protein
VDAFDADVLIYAAAPGHPLGRLVRALFPAEPVTTADRFAGVGSLLLLPELLSKPMRDGAGEEVAALGAILGRIDLLAVDRATAELATALGASYGLRAADATHLATAVLAGADRFITNNKADFSKAISEIDVVYPEDLSDATGT